MSGTSVGVAVKDVVDCRDVVLGKATLADLGRDLERRNGDEKRCRLFGSSGLSAVVQERVMGVASAGGIDTNSSSLEASRGCVES